ncbi:hypothetical protein RNJ44_02615 [Nakaseomyces bracarensis]|uniref:Target of rapamycin complex 2 subunit BIT2 n=1 Tax=Nakaseomyces bracarensis TaxID=273131 RepID=A0ABR4NZQ7_9SACH
MVQGSNGRRQGAMSSTSSFTSARNRATSTVSKDSQASGHLSNYSRVYNISSDIVPQTLTHPDEESNVKKVPGSVEMGSSVPRWSQVGFQSIFQGNSSGPMRMRNSSDSFGDEIKFQKLRNTASVDRFDTRMDDSKITEEEPYQDSLYSNGSQKTKEKRRISLFSNNRENSSPLLKTERKSSLFKPKATKSTSSMNTHLLNSPTTTKNKHNPFSKMARKLLSNKSHKKIGSGDTEAAPQNSFSKFLHASYGKHKVSSQFIHTAGGLIDSARSVHSFSPSMVNIPNDTPMSINVTDDMIESANVAMLHDLLKNLSSLEANYKGFTSQELHILAGNIWGIYCGVIIELFKMQRIWQLPAKIEDINRILDFYIVIKTESKASVSYKKFLSEIEEFLTTSLYILENQIVFNYSNEETMNTALKRVGVIWQVFYQQVYFDVLSVFLPLEKITKKFSRYSGGLSQEGSKHSFLTIDYLLLKCFRDSIVLPYYQNFIHSNDGASKSFQQYIFNEEEESGVTEHDKLTLLQCFGILETIQGNDRNQVIIDELLEGIRMSI